MKRLAFILAALFLVCSAKSQEPVKTINRTIEVTGSAEIEVAPDEIHIIIGVKEYWKEEFDKNAKVKDFKTKIPILEIEGNLFADLEDFGITKENIIVREVGNYKREKRKQFLVGKEYDIVLSDASKINEVLQSLDTKGISYMSLGKMENKNITKYRAQVKVEAAKAAKTKAESLVNACGAQLGDVITIVEVNENQSYWNSSFRSNSFSNTMINNATTVNIPASVDKVEPIKLRYEIKVVFGIK